MPLNKDLFNFCSLNKNEIGLYREYKDADRESAWNPDNENVRSFCQSGFGGGIIGA